MTTRVLLSYLSISWLSLSFSAESFTWYLCCPRQPTESNAVAAAQTNYIFPLVSYGPIFGVLAGVQSLATLAAALPPKTLTVVSPYSYTIGDVEKGKEDSLISLANFITFPTNPVLLGHDEWQIANTIAGESHQYVTLQFEAVDEINSFNCKLPLSKMRSSIPFSDMALCLRMSVSKKPSINGNNFITVQYVAGSAFDSQLLPAVFSYIRSSEWAATLAVPATSLTLGLDSDWHKHIASAGLVDSSLWDRFSPPLHLPSQQSQRETNVPTIMPTIAPLPLFFKLSSYITDSAKNLMKQLGNPKVMVAWSVQEELLRGVKVKSYVYKHTDELGYIIGCQINNMLNTMHSFQNESIVFAFDIFEGPRGEGVRDMDPKPTYLNKRDIVHSLRGYFKSMLILPALLKKQKISLYDPAGVFKGSQELLLSWIEVALGTMTDEFIAAGGSMSSTIMLFREMVTTETNKGRTSKTLKRNHCELSLENDDLVSMLKHDDR